MALPISEIPESEDTTVMTDEEAYATIRIMVEALDNERDAMDVARSYYDGEQDLKYSTTEFTRAFGAQFDDLVANWCEVVVSATENRLEMDRVVFRDEEEGDINTDITAAIWKVFQDNDIDELENELYSSAMVESRSAVIVWPSKDGDDQDVLVTSNRGQTIKVIYEDDNPLRPQFAIKKWRTQLGEVFLTFYTNEWVYKYKIPKQVIDISEDITRHDTFESSGWTKRSVVGEPWPLANPFDSIPVVEFPGRKFRSELNVVMPIQDAINKELIDMMVASGYASSAQAYLVTSNSEPDGGWKRRPGEVWQIQPEVDLDGKALPTAVGTLPAEDPSNIIAIIEHLLAQLSNLSSTPGYYIFNSESSGGRGDAPSGDSLRVGETTLMKKIEKYQQMYNHKWVRVGQYIHEALVYRSKASGDLPEYGEVAWSNPQKHFMGMLLEEGRKMIDELGLPPWYAWAHVGLSEAQIEDAKDYLEQQKKEEEERMERDMKAKADASLAKTGASKNDQSKLRSGSTPQNT